jgi:hypothetical protein
MAARNFENFVAHNVEEFLSVIEDLFLDVAIRLQVLNTSAEEAAKMAAWAAALIRLEIEQRYGRIKVKKYPQFGSSEVIMHVTDDGQRYYKEHGMNVPVE